MKKLFLFIAVSATMSVMAFAAAKPETKWALSPQTMVVPTVRISVVRPALKSITNASTSAAKPETKTALLPQAASPHVQTQIVRPALLKR